ncbi:MAG TPA: hypothetical protein VFE24_03715 [Pirellulales bacterium]|nr:hypothetical protein [Pirellulales bacterium]
MSQGSACPKCHRLVSLPVAANPHDTVRCPLCQAQYSLREAIEYAPPRLEVVGAALDEGADFHLAPEEPHVAPIAWPDEPEAAARASAEDLTSNYQPADFHAADFHAASGAQAETDPADFSLPAHETPHPASEEPESLFHAHEPDAEPQLGFRPEPEENVAVPEKLFDPEHAAEMEAKFGPEEPAEEISATEFGEEPLGEEAAELPPMADDWFAPGAKPANPEAAEVEKMAAEEEFAMAGPVDRPEAPHVAAAVKKASLPLKSPAKRRRGPPPGGSAIGKIISIACGLLVAVAIVVPATWWITKKDVFQIVDKPWFPKFLAFALPAELKRDLAKPPATTGTQVANNTKPPAESGKTGTPADKKMPGAIGELPNKNFETPTKPDATTPDAKPDVKPDAKPETKPDPFGDTKPETKPDVKPEPKPETKPDPFGDTKPDTKPDVKPEPKPETKPDPFGDAKPDTKPDIKPEPKPETKPDPFGDTKPDTKPDVKPEPKPETKPDPFGDTKPEVKPEPKPETKPDPFGDTKPETKPEVKPEPNPETKPAGLKNAPLVTQPEMETAAKEASEAAKALDEPAADVSPAALKQAYYKKLFALAEKVALAPQQPGANTAMDTLKQLVLRGGATPDALNPLGRIAAYWISSPRRDPAERGIVLNATINSIEKQNGLNVAKVTLTGGLPEGRPADFLNYTVVSKEGLPEVGSTALLVGVIVDQPATAIEGFKGDQKQVIWTVGSIPTKGTEPAK